LYILGINAFHGDASAAIFRDGALLAAVEEERFTRVKHTAGFPYHAIRYCLETAGVSAEGLDHVVIPRKRSAHLMRKAFWALRLPHMAMDRASVWRRFGDVRDVLAQYTGTSPGKLKAQFHFVEHHVAHASSSFYASPYRDASLLSLDGLGDFASMLWGAGNDRDFDAKGFELFPDSLGLFYTAITQYLGFLKYGDEYKVMGLASYGEPKYKDLFSSIVRTNGNLGFDLDMRYFVHHRKGPEMSWAEGEPKQGKLFSEALERALGPARQPGAPLEQKHQDIAATLQWRLEEAVFHLVNLLHKRTGSPNLCYAGGVAFNCVANGKLFDRTPFRHLYIQSAAGDAGLAIGAAQYVYHQVLGHPRGFVMTHAYWGPEYPPEQIKTVLQQRDLRFDAMEQPQLAEATARRIADGAIVGWYQGRAEWGPRALGNRSIVVDPRRPDMKDVLNSRIKHREPFRPFAPSILEHETANWFEKSYPSPFMLMAYPVRKEKRDKIPAPTHVDGTGRLQTVTEDANPRYFGLIEAFQKQTGVPVLLNTSFNENEPVVNTPQEAVDCFLRTKMDCLAIGPYLVERPK